MIVDREVMKEQLCRVLHKTGAIKFGTFKLTSGKTSPYYVDLRVVPSFPDAFHKVCDTYAHLIRGDIGVDSFHRIAGIPTAGIPFASVVAYRLDKPFFYTRPAQREHGRERKVEGVLMPGDKVVLLDDLITGGKSLIAAATAIRAEGGVVSDAVVLINREEGGERTLVRNKIKLHYLLKAGDAANMLYDMGALTGNEMKTILQQKQKV